MQIRTGAKPFANVALKPGLSPEGFPRHCWDFHFISPTTRFSLPPRGVAGAHSSGGAVSHDPNIAAPLTVLFRYQRSDTSRPGRARRHDHFTFSSRRVLSGILLTAHVRTSTDSSYLQSKLPPSQFWVGCITNTSGSRF